MESNVLTTSFEETVWNFLQGERLTSEQITNGLRHTIPDLKKSKVMTALRNLRKQDKADRNSMSGIWRVLY